MKCERKKCQREAEEDRLYCSKSCAQSERLEATLTRSASPVPPSGQTGPGEASDPSSPVEGWLASDPAPRWPTPSPDVRKTEPASGTIGSTSSESEKISEPTGTESLPSGESSETSSGSLALLPTSDAEKKPSHGTPEEVRLMAFIAPSPDSVAASSPSTNLIDSSLMQLHELMQHVAKENPRSRCNPDSINAVCNLAKNIRELLVLKLNVVKTARKLDGMEKSK